MTTQVEPHSTTSHARRRRISATTIAVLLAFAFAGVAQAKVYSSEPWSNDWTETACDAGYVITGHDSGRSTLEEPTAATPEFFRLTNVYKGHTVVRNPANGKSFTEDWAGVFREHSIVRQTAYPGYVYRYRTTDAAVYVVSTKTGKVAYHDAGRVVTSYLFDTQGDGSVGAPGGSYLEDSVELVNTWDPSFDFCKLADRLIG
jgi:hypothetical protein